MGQDVICRGCGWTLSQPPVFQMDPMPLAGAFSDTREGAIDLPKLPLSWLQCGRCQLVQVAEDVPDETLYTKYCYASSTVPALQQHFAEYASMLMMRMAAKEVRVLEIGCNDGVLLKQLPSHWDRWGVDPSDVAAAGCDGTYSLINKPFTTELHLEGFDLVLASNCLAHMTGIADAVEAAASALRQGGEFWVEVHDLEATLSTGQWDTVYHEHKAEYSVRSLCNVIRPHGFSLIGVWKLPLHGGLLRAGFRRSHDRYDRFLTSDDFSLLNEMYAQRRDGPLYRTLKGGAIAYGAAGRATVWFNQMPELEFAAVIDDSPLRAGRFVPGVGWPIVPWEDRPESKLCLITAWNYADAIKARRQYDGRWLQTWSST